MANSVIERLAREIGYPTVEQVLIEDFQGVGTMFHDWRAFVPVEVRDEWQNLSQDTRLAFFIMAEERDNQKDWRP